MHRATYRRLMHAACTTALSNYYVRGRLRSVRLTAVYGASMWTMDMTQVEMADTAPENVPPQSADAVKAAIDLLVRVSKMWSDVHELSHLEEDGLGLLLAAGLVERGLVIGLRVVVRCRERHSTQRDSSLRRTIPIRYTCYAHTTARVATQQRSLTHP